MNILLYLPFVFILSVICVENNNTYIWYRCIYVHMFWNIHLYFWHAIMKWNKNQLYRNTKKFIW